MNILLLLIKYNNMDYELRLQTEEKYREDEEELENEIIHITMLWNI
jgi:hypothetical protein